MFCEACEFAEINCIVNYVKISSYTYIGTSKIQPNVWTFVADLKY